ncbi:MAG: hypothetical protein E6767_20530 [Dysgonomonas sp.]|nr:hypothetical protein [Dysgonomonas sp.]
MKKKIFITILICLSISVIFFLSVEWNVDIYMESTPPRPHDKIDLKISIDNEIIFNDTLQRNPFSYPTHIEYPMRIGFHTISLSSEKANIQIKKDIFIFVNHHLAIYYFGFDTISMEPIVHIIKGNGDFGYE